MKKKLLLVSLGLSWAAHCWAAEITTLEQITVEETALSEPVFSATKETLSMDSPMVPSDTLSEVLKNTFYVEKITSSAYSSEPYIRGRGACSQISQ